jgi:hypothetical protein
VDEWRREFEFNHLSEHVLSSSVVHCKTSIFANCDKQVTSWRVSKRSDGLFELSEQIAHNPQLLDVEESNRAVLEAARE